MHVVIDRREGGLVGWWGGWMVKWRLGGWVVGWLDGLVVGWWVRRIELGRVIIQISIKVEVVFCACAWVIGIACWK